MANEEQLVWDGLTLNDSTFGLAELQCPPPRERPEWIGAADSEAQLLARTPLHENREITVKLQVSPQSTRDLALDKLGQLVDKCVKASKYPDGIALTWTPSTSTRTVTFDVLDAEIVDLPIDNENGWMLAMAPTVTIQMRAKPYWRGTETLTSTTSSSTPFVTAELVNNSGDVPATGRLIVTDTATQSRRHVEWGLEGPLTYNSSTSLLIDSDNMVTSGFGGTQTTQAGAYDPNASGNSCVGITARTAVAAVAGVGDLAHVGSFRVKGRVYSDAATVSVRLAWKAADGPMVSNSWAVHRGGSAWQEMDLGTIIVPTVIAGTQRWTGQVEVKTSSSTATVRVDYLELVPTSCGYGKARGVLTDSTGALSGFDDFTGTTSGNVLHTATTGRAAPLGGNWVTSGAATDFTFSDLRADATTGSVENVTRETQSDASRRFAILGSSAFTDVSATIEIENYQRPSNSTFMDQGLVLRWVDSSNYLAVYQKAESSSTGSPTTTLIVEQVVAGVTTILAQDVISASMPWSRSIHTLTATVYTSGRYTAEIYAAPSGGSSTPQTLWGSVEGSTSVLATGGTLDDGAPGLLDRYTGTGTDRRRRFDNVQVTVPRAEPIVIYSGRNMQIRHDDTIRQDSTGTYTGRPASYRGTRFVVPVGTSRVMVKARRNDIDTTVDDNVTDATQIAVGITPRGLVVPRS